MNQYPPINSSPKGRLVKVLADVTNKPVIVSLIVLGYLSLLILYIVANYYVPRTFTELKGEESCELMEHKKAMCHRFKFSQGSIWTAYIGRLHKDHQFFIIGGQVIRKFDNTKLNFELPYKIKMYPVDIYGNVHEDSDDF